MKSSILATAVVLALHSGAALAQVECEGCVNSVGAPEAKSFYAFAGSGTTATIGISATVVVGACDDDDELCYTRVGCKATVVRTWSGNFATPAGPGSFEVGVEVGGRDLELSNPPTPASSPGIHQIVWPAQGQKCGWEATWRFKWESPYGPFLDQTVSVTCACTECPGEDA